MTRLRAWFVRQFWSGVVFVLVVIVGLLCSVPLVVALYGAAVAWAVCEYARVEGGPP